MQGTMDHSRRQLPPMAPHKRKVRDETFDFLKPSRPIRPPPPKLAKPKTVAPPSTAPIKPSSKPSVSSPAQAPANNNILLAGYLAHEYLHKGTLFGQLYTPAPPASPATSSAGSKTMIQPSSGSLNGERGKAVELKPKLKPKPGEKKRIHEPQLVKNQRYADVSQLLKDGVHIPGIVNPSQLARFLHL
ncbi:unnamed protein product [Lactuca virosa]|uniref:Uncharacterized protein n=1 Tax=Lactuca virosa TaxID=75947 RepID=A0AAU9PAK9_9ASTR|nr:unnamed protein product [Lactuca virosa]